MITCRPTYRKFLVLGLFTVLLLPALHAQLYTRQTFHDREKKNLKEVYQVKDTLRNILHGRYISYYVNGNVESKGQFTNNETTGVWEFFYETGNLKMRGILRQNANYGLWEYFYESGQKSMDGNINGKNREGEWKLYYENGQVKEIGEYKSNKRIGLWSTYFEDGVLRGEIDYEEDFGTYTEYYHSGKILSEGPKSGTKPVGHWRYFAEDGTLQSEGDYNNGKRHGEWTSFYASGKTSSKGRYDNDLQIGRWEYYFEDGKASTVGDYLAGLKNGNWKTYNGDGTVKSEALLIKGSGDYREYYSDGKLKAKGRIDSGKKQGLWEYFYNDGKLEGQCDYNKDKGTYIGYYDNGSLKTKGTIDGELKIGTWELYENDGKLAGYYRPFYEDRKLGKEIVALSQSKKANASGSNARKLTHFDARFNEFRGVIIGTNPVMMFAGRVPFGMEFYLQERLGHEFEFIGIREPFFVADYNIPTGKKFERGYGISIKQKLYNPMKVGMWYYGQEIRFTNIGHFINQPVTPTSRDVFTYSAVEQRIEWGALLGYRVMQKSNSKGFTIDAFVSADVGYRGFDVDTNFADYFKDIRQGKVSTSFHFGLNFGKVFSFR
jgi:antitoxin component YwqK of YwqJK toxin-antitoxin module